MKVDISVTIIIANYFGIEFQDAGIEAEPRRLEILE